jgi:hypothetical protein
MASQELMVMRQHRLLKRWLRYAENLKATEEEMIYHCEPETRKGLDDDEEDELRSADDLTDCQEDNKGISHCQLGNN